MQDLSNQYLIEKREPQPASSSSRPLKLTGLQRWATYYELHEFGVDDLWGLASNSDYFLSPTSSTHTQFSMSTIIFSYFGVALTLLGTVGTATLHMCRNIKAIGWKKILKSEWMFFVPNIIHAHTIFNVHHHLLLFWRTPDSALNCWYSHMCRNIKAIGWKYLFKIWMDVQCQIRLG